jgi:hypothetical protein
MKRLRWPGRDRRSMVRTVFSAKMTLIRFAMGSALTISYPHYIHTAYVYQIISIVYHEAIPAVPALPRNWSTPLWHY